MVFPLLLLSVKYGKRFHKRIALVEERYETLMGEQYVLMDDLPSAWTIIPISMGIQGVNPCNVSEIQADYLFSGWMTNFATRGYKSFAEFVDQPIGIFVAKDTKDFVMQLVRSNLEKNYQKKICTNIICENNDYMIVNFQTIHNEHPIQ